MKVQLKRLTLDFDCYYNLSIFSTKLAFPKNRVLQTPDFFVSSEKKAFQKKQTDLEALHFICFSSPGIHDFLEVFFILQSVLVISKIGLPRRDSCREKLSVWKKQKPWNTGGRLVAFVLLGRFIQSWTINAEWITSLVQIFSFSYS